jgi:hypothetical protein
MTALEIHFLSDHRPDSTEVWICLFVLFVMSENKEDDLDRFFAEVLEGLGDDLGYTLEV